MVRSLSLLLQGNFSVKEIHPSRGTNGSVLHASFLSSELEPKRPGAFELKLFDPELLLVRLSSARLEEVDCISSSIVELHQYRVLSWGMKVRYGVWWDA